MPLAAQELVEVVTAARGLGAEGLVTTEKDWMRLAGIWKFAFPLFVVHLEVNLLDPWPAHLLPPGCAQKLSVLMSKIPLLEPVAIGNHHSPLPRAVQACFQQLTVHRRRQFFPHQIHSILVRAVNWLGDAVLTLPAIRQLKRFFPQANSHYPGT